MQKIKFIADTASDIPDDLMLKYNIDMPSVPIAVDGKEYFERRSFSIHEFYKILAKTKEIPKTSRVPADDFLAFYEKAYEDGYTDIICVTINAGGSGTNMSAHMARDILYKKRPEAKDKIKIHIIDSKTYTMAYGYPVVQSARMAQDGKDVGEILLYLHDFFDTCEVLLGCYTLEYAKKSGRISSVAAFAGDALGLKPVVEMIDGRTKVVAKARGDKQLIPQLVKLYEERRCSEDGFVMVACGAVTQYGIDLQQALKEKLGRDVPIFNAGASIVINSGPNIAAVIYRGRKR